MLNYDAGYNFPIINTEDNNINKPAFWFYGPTVYNPPSYKLTIHEKDWSAITHKKGYSRVVHK